MKPSWDDAPAWANYLAMDKSGRWYWYEYKPWARFESWWEHREGQKCLAMDALVSWTDTLEGRYD